MAETRLLALSSAFFLLSFCCLPFAQSLDFPTIDEIEVAFYSTEVQVTDVVEEAAAYATEYYNNIDDQGSLKIYFQGDVRSIYYDNSTYQITEVVGPNCTATDEDISDYDYYPIYHGWLNKNPLVIGPSAPIWYAQGKTVNYIGDDDARNIKCDKFELPILNKKENLTIEYFFAKTNWATPYQSTNKLRVPVRIRIVGTSSRYSANDKPVPVEIINDFAYFKPSISDLNDLLPPIGLGCKLKQETDDFPDIPKVFQYSAEVVDLMQAAQHEDFEIRYQRVWYDHPSQLARLDRFTKLKGYTSTLHDFNTGTLYKIVDSGSCQMSTLKNSAFEVFDYGNTRRMMEPKEALYLDGTFYEMGKRQIRGIACDTYESVAFDAYFEDKYYYKLVVTVYFTETTTNVGINGETESRIPVYYLINGWDSPTNKTLQKQYNIFEFNDVIYPEMYSSFNLQQCYTTPDSKAYFILILDVPTKVAAFMEDNDALVIPELRSMVSDRAKVPEMRIPYLKADYKTTGVYVTGVILERPPAFLQFYKWDEGDMKTRDPDLKIVPEAATLEQCSYSCVDEGDFPCKGFYFCGSACFLKSLDITDEADGEETILGDCEEYLRAEIESTNFRQSYLSDALGNLETAVLNKTVYVVLPIDNGEEIIKVEDVVIGDGPYTGVDAGDKDFIVSVPGRKLGSAQRARPMEYTTTLHDCYKRCKEAGSMCSSFSFCPDSPKDNKECMITSELIVRGDYNDADLVNGPLCNVYTLKFLDYFTAAQERVSLLPGDKVIEKMESTEKCAKECRLEKDFKCRGFEYCRSAKACTLHKKHILDLKPGETAKSQKCVHFSARYVADYQDLGGVLIDDKSDVRTSLSLEECAKICSEELQEQCKSFNYCPDEDEEFIARGSCALSSKLLRDDGTTTTEKWGKCSHYEKRDTVHDWNNSKAKSLAATGYTKKGFAGLVVGMLALGLIAGAIAFVVYSYMKSRNSGEGMAVRFMKNET